MNDEPTDTELIAGFVQWAHVNAIDINNYSYAEIQEFAMRYLKAAG